MDDDIRDTARDSWKAVQKANQPEQFFNYGGLPSWIKCGDDMQAEIEVIDAKKMLYLAGEVVAWYKVKAAGQYPSRPPKPVADHMVASPHPPLPRLRRLTRVPVFDRDGHLVSRVGFDERSGMFLAPKGLQDIRVAHTPTAKEIQRAGTVIVDELLGDFDFVSDADTVNAVALLLLPFVREMIVGPTPLHLITKPKPGSGGTLLAEALLYPALGQQPPMQTLPADEAEIQRRITAALATGPAAIVFDNIKTGMVLDSAQLAGALTMAEWQDRVIRTSYLATLPISNTWVATGNNVSVSDEIARRTLPIRLDPKVENPFERTGFKHHPLEQWMAENRADLVWSALTLVQAWVAQGMPEGSADLGKYARWAKVLSGILDAAGLPGLISNWHDWNGSRPSEDKDLMEVIALWQMHLDREREYRSGELLPMIGPTLGISSDANRSSETKLGSRLTKLQSREVDGIKIVGRDVSGSMLWRLQRAEPDRSGT
jgi:hypothetical protein